MASRRNLKKNINYITGALFAECITLSKTQNADQVKINELMIEILNMQSEFIARISHTEPGNIKGFYKKLHEDFNAKSDEIIDRIIKLN